MRANEEDSYSVSTYAGIRINIRSRKTGEVKGTAGKRRRQRYAAARVSARRRAIHSTARDAMLARALTAPCHATHGAGGDTLRHTQIHQPNVSPPRRRSKGMARYRLFSRPAFPLPGARCTEAAGLGFRFLHAAAN